MSCKEFPSNADYTTIVKNLKAFIVNKDIQSGKPQYSKMKRLISYAGGYSKVFPVYIKNRKIALRFWTANIEESQKRYQEIERYLKLKNLSYFVGFSYHNNSLKWKNDKYPFISMDWIEGKTLNKYLDNNIDNSDKVKKLAELFLEMVQSLHKNDIAHGDLQDGNILVIENGSNIELKLIDYDSLFVPKLRDFTIEIIGVEAYQHPNKNDMKKLNEKIDYFSELVIYLSLLVYAENSTLWEQGQDQKLVFESKDFRDTQNSKIFNHLKNSKYSSKIVELTIRLEEYCMKRSINDLFPLENEKSDKFKGLFDNILESTKNVIESFKVDHGKWDRDMDSIKKIFSSTSVSKEAIDKKKQEEADKKFKDAMKRMRR